MIDEYIYHAIALAPCDESCTIIGAPSPDTVKATLDRAVSFQ